MEFTSWNSHSYGHAIAARRLPAVCSARVLGCIYGVDGECSRGTSAGWGAVLIEGEGHRARTGCSTGQGHDGSRVNGRGATGGQGGGWWWGWGKDVK